LLGVVRALERVPFFHDLPRAQLRLIAQTTSPLTVAPRTVLIRQGHPSGKLYVIVGGQAAVLQQSAPGASPRLLARLGPDELFGELELLDAAPPSASVVALSPLELLVVPHSAVADLLRGTARPEPRGGLNRGPTGAALL
jgi:putative peptide zinc metalloprotease protein